MNSHVCHVITSLSVGGAEQYVAQLSNYLVSNGSRVSIVAGEPITISGRLDDRVHVETLEMHPGVTRSVFHYARILPNAIRRLTNYFRRENVTVVHTHLTASALPAWIAAKLCGIPVIHSKMYVGIHGSPYERVLFATRLPLLLVNSFVAFTRYSEDEIVKHWHAPRSRILESSIGVDTRQFTLHAESMASSRAKLDLKMSDKVILVVARLHPEKDVELAIRAARAVNTPGTVLLIAGDGPQRKYLEDLAGLQPSGHTAIRFLGSLQDPRHAYAAADMLLQTTRSPNMGMVVLEAMASGVPVLIAYRDQEEHKMAVDTLSGQSIGAVAQATPDAIAAKVAELFNDPTQLETWRSEVRRFVENQHSQLTVYPAMMANYSALELSLSKSVA